jgi:hypothetical protein
MSDREALLGLAEALNSAPRTLRRDECGDWRINGKVGHIYAVPDGFLLYAVASSQMAWTYAKRALSFAKLTNDGDTEGMFALVRLPSPTEAKTIRSYLGRVTRSLNDSARLEFKAAVRARYLRKNWPWPTARLPDNLNTAPAEKIRRVRKPTRS